MELKPLEWYVEGMKDLQTGRMVCNSPKWHVWGETDNNPAINRYDAMIASFARMVLECCGVKG